MNPSAELRAREFVTTGFRSLGVPDLEPYIKIIAELIDGAENDARQQVGQALMEVANQYPVGTADVLHGIGERLSVSTTEALAIEGLMVLADEIIAAEESGPKCAGNFTPPLSGPCPICGATEDDECRAPLTSEKQPENP